MTARAARGRSLRPGANTPWSTGIRRQLGHELEHGLGLDRARLGSGPRLMSSGARGSILGLDDDVWHYVWTVPAEIVDSTVNVA